MDEQLKTNLTSSASWIRFIFMVVFAIILQIASLVMGAVVIIQFLFVLITGERNNNLRKFGLSMSVYFFSTLKYLTYNSDEKPFPFSEWPDAEEGEELLAENNSETETFSSRTTESTPPPPAVDSAPQLKAAPTKRAVDPDLTAEVVEEVIMAEERAPLNDDDESKKKAAVKKSASKKPKVSEKPKAEKDKVGEAATEVVDVDNKPPVEPGPNETEKA